MRRKQFRIAGLVLALLAETSSSQSWIATSFGVPDEQVGAEPAIVGDIDGDGLPEVATNGVVGSVGKVKVFRGFDLSLLYELTGADFTFGLAIAGLGDIDGDGASDLAIGAPDQPPGSSSPGEVTIHSGTTGAVLRTLTGLTTSSKLGVELAAGPDLDGDGFGDLIVGDKSSTWIYSTATWNILLTLPSPGVLCVPGDVDLDGLPDIATGVTNLVQVFSTSSGRVLLYSQKPSAQDYGFALAPMGDVDGDGIPELVVGAHSDSTLKPFGGSAHVISAFTGETMVVAYGNQEQSWFGRAVCGVGDVDGDSLVDFAVGAENQTATGWTGDWGVVQIRSSANGDLVTRFEGQNAVANFGSVLAGPADVNGDGFLDLCTSSTQDKTAGSSSGSLAVLSTRFRVSQFSPPEVLHASPGVVEMHGGGFDPALPISITVEGVPAVNPTWVSPELVTFVPPAAAQDVVADVIFEQDGLSVICQDALHYIGPEILDIYPPVGSLAGGDVLHILGKNFATDGSAAVKIYAGTATIQQASEGEIVAVTPPYTPGSPFNLQVLGSTGIATSQAFKADDDDYGTPNRGNIAGGSTCLLVGLQANHTGTGAKVFMGVGGAEAQVIAVTPSTMTIQTPPLAEANGASYSAFISDPIKGNESIGLSFMYTPYLKASFVGQKLGGGSITLQVIPDPAASTPQLLSMWIGSPSASPTSLVFPNYSGVLHEPPWLFLTLLAPLPQPVPVLDVEVPIYDPLLAGLVLRFQAHVTGEGLAKGSFTNAATVTLP